MIRRVFLFFVIALVTLSNANTCCAAEVYSYDCTGAAQTFSVTCDGIYKIELWGACPTDRSDGAYVCGEISLNEGETIYIYVGGKGIDVSKTVFNGGGHIGSIAGGATVLPPVVWQGSGATDVRLISGDWDDILSLQSRIIVAAGAGGGEKSSDRGGHAGGLTGYDGSDNQYGSFLMYGGKGASQTSGGNASAFDRRTIGDYGISAGEPGRLGIGGKGGEGRTHPVFYYGGRGGGGGYYGGGGSSGGGFMTGGNTPGGGGSSYISGHAGCIALVPEKKHLHELASITASIHHSGRFFVNTVMIDGVGYTWTSVRGEKAPMPNPNGVDYAIGSGHNGNGFARITLLKRTLGSPVIVRHKFDDTGWTQN